MRQPPWTPTEIAEAYRSQGVPWAEADIQQKAALVWRGLQRWGFRWLHHLREVSRHEVAAGLMQREEDDRGLVVLDRQERFHREDWEHPHARSHSGGGVGSAA